MLNTEIYLINLLTTTTAVTNIVPAANISIGPFDSVIEKQGELRMPMINIHQVSESVRTVPLGARDSQYQLDIWSRESQLEVEQIYEAVLTAMNFIDYNQGDSHTFWERLSGATDIYESEMRVWHRSCTFMVWAIQP